MHEEIHLPEPIEASDELLKNSWATIRDHMDPFVAFLEKKDQGTFLQSDEYEQLNTIDEGTLAYKAYVKPGEDDVIPEIEIPHPQASSIKVFKVNNQSSYEKMVNQAKETVAYFDKAIEDYTNAPTGMTEYANALIDEIKVESELVDEAKKASEEWAKEAKNTNYYLDQRRNRIREEMERINESIAKNKQEIERIDGRLSELGDDLGEESFEYNPFKPRIDKGQLEMGKKIAQKEIEELTQKQQQLEKDEQEISRTELEIEAETERVNDQLQKSEERLKMVQSQVEKDANFDRFDESKEKAVEFMKAMTSNCIQRHIDGFSTPYVSLRSPVRLGKSAFGPVVDVSRERNMMSKIASANRRGFPVYDTVIEADKMDQTLCDYWKEKGNKELPIEREQTYRRKLYDHASRLEAYLDTMYKTIEDPVKNKELHDLQFTDPGNDPFHFHEKANRGSAVLRASAEAYRMGIENNWRTEDLGTLSYFNYTRRQNRFATLGNGAVDLHQYKAYDKPVYMDAHHEEWLDKMDSLWNKMQEGPVFTASGRDQYLKQMYDLMEEGFQKGYVSENQASCFSTSYNYTRNPEIEKQIAEDKIPAAVQTDGLAIGEDGKKNIESLKNLEKYDINKADIVAGSLDNQKDTIDNYIDSLDSDVNRELNESFISYDDRPELENPDMSILFPDMNQSMSFEEPKKPEPKTDYDLENALHNFNTKRSSVFLNRESKEHENLRKAVEEMRKMKESMGVTSDLRQMAAYLEKVDAVMTYSEIYQKEKSDANTPAGQDRLRGAKELAAYAKNEQRRLREAYNEIGNTNVTLDDIRLNNSVTKALEAEGRIKEICGDSMPKTDAAKKEVSNLVADMLVADFAQSPVPGNQKKYKKLGAEVIKNEITGSKEYQKVMEGYFKKKDFGANDLIAEMSSGKLFKRMAAQGKMKEAGNEEMQLSKQQKQASAQRAHTM